MDRACDLPDLYAEERQDQSGNQKRQRLHPAGQFESVVENTNHRDKRPTRRMPSACRLRLTSRLIARVAAIGDDEADVHRHAAHKRGRSSVDPASTRMRDYPSLLRNMPDYRGEYISR